MIHSWTLGLIFTVSGLLAALPALGAETGKVQKRAGDASYWKEQKRLERRINDTAYDASSAVTECVMAMLGGYGPVCGHAVDQITDAINRTADWREEAEKLRPANAAFHKQWLGYIDCRREQLRREKVQAQLLQIHAVERANEGSEARLEKQKECGEIGVEIFKRKKDLGIRDEE